MTFRMTADHIELASKLSPALEGEVQDLLGQISEHGVEVGGRPLEEANLSVDDLGEFVPNVAAIQEFLSNKTLER